MAALAGFVPEIWSSKINLALQKSLVFASVCNRDYEGEVSGFGDVVKINAIGPIAVADYTPDSSTLTYAILSDAQRELKIDQAKSISFKVDDVVAAQVKPKVMAGAMADGAYRLANAADTHIAGKWTEAAIIYGLGTVGTPIPITSINIMEYMGLTEQKLSEANVPEIGRFMVLAPWMYQKIRLARVVLDTTNSTIISNGYVGSIFGFNIYKSNNVAMLNTVTQTDTKNLAGYSGSMTFAEQLMKIETLRIQASFHDGVRGLYLYGCKMGRPDSMALLRTTYTAEP